MEIFFTILVILNVIFCATCLIFSNVSLKIFFWGKNKLEEMEMQSYENSQN